MTVAQALFSSVFAHVAGNLLAAAAGTASEKAPAPLVAAADEETDCPVGKVLPSFDDVRGKQDLIDSLRQLRTTVEHRDLTSLKSLLADGVQFSFDDAGKGKDGFLRYWHFGRRDDPAASGLWAEMAAALNHGGSWVDGEFCFPYAYAAWPDECDYADYALVLRDGAALYRTSTEHSPVLEHLHTEIVETPSGFSRTWVQVTSKTGHEGYVREADIAQAASFRGCLRMEKGAWHLSSFVAGD